MYLRDQFLALLPPPRRLTLDLGCGEGRLSRDLETRGHRVVGVDGSPTLVRLAREADADIARPTDDRTGRGGGVIAARAPSLLRSGSEGAYGFGTL
ncbi:MAG: methyltransferase domain-containing protein [Deltaproteobacteria bacterium]|nr:MAG: methyltransferase domain-containing protein [Deltaproteobacteria bacterium]TMA58177.1 MAG: methyltransferase domain-containing protein [Deltaproteobacteria bacterium]